ncbi:hypothetical protein DFH08DRAFT_846125 [Mycena albidolilacea]|uniref:Uncharacterized protein n=1 Tax=Mycena albidolilacea TaxID=1033008 RepID=A0AAD7AI78_9AGAR|nr:hypothetical protein DFH08DRAFT_846125 [Mycena albidolilacea]
MKLLAPLKRRSLTENSSAQLVQNTALFCDTFKVHMVFAFSSGAKIKASFSLAGSKLRALPSRTSAGSKLRTSSSHTTAGSDPHPIASRTPRTLPDVLSTSLRALKESSDAFPPLKSAVSGVIVVWEIAERAKHSKADACDIAQRTEDILNVVADAVPDPSVISPAMEESLERFTILLDDIRRRMESMALTSVVSRALRLNRNERTLQGIKVQLDYAYRDVVASAVLRIEAQQTQLALQQAQTHCDITKIVATTETLAPDQSRILAYCRVTVFLASP